MSSTGTSRNRSRGTQGSSVNQTRKKHSHCKGEVEKISKYFKKLEDGCESPYKNCLGEMKSDKLSDSSIECDFQTPKHINKVSKIASKPEGKNKNVKKGKRTRQPPLRKFMEDNFKHVDVNPEHLQMALALSNSTFEAENPDQNLSQQEKKENFKKAFEKYGLGYSKSRIPAETKRPVVAKRNKKSRFRFITPILIMRTEEERQRLIDLKVSQITTQIKQKPPVQVGTSSTDLICETLKNHIQSKIFPLNNQDWEKLEDRKFYVSKLALEKCPASCGRLLKDWKKIPGRSRTPEHQIITTVVETHRKSPILDTMDTDNNSNSSQTIANNEIQLTPNKSASSTDLWSEDEPGFLNLGEKSKQDLIGFSVKDDSPLAVDLTNQIDVNKSTNQTTVDLTKEETVVWKQISSGFGSGESSFTCLEKPRRGKYCLSPDLFGSDDEQIIVASKDIQCFDLTRSDDEEEKQICPSRLSDYQNSYSDLNVTDYVQNLLSQHTGNENVGHSKQQEGERKLETISTSEEESQQSQDTIYISDDELNYSSVCSTPPAKKKIEYSFSDDEEIYLPPISERLLPKTTTLRESNSSKGDQHMLREELNVSKEDSSCGEPTLFEKQESGFQALLDNSLNDVLQQIPLSDTPNAKEKNFFIKIKNITPMRDYDRMDTPKIVKELDKFGLKPLKRQKGVKLLKYIYDSTHPVVRDENGKVVKKRRTDNSTDLKNPIGCSYHCPMGETPDGEIVFERKQSKKVLSCPVPLHIVWHNFLMCNSAIRESVLLYEPLQLEVLHSMIKKQGFKFNIQDLLSFLDRRCVTVRVAQEQRQGPRKPRISSLKH